MAATRSLTAALALAAAARTVSALPGCYDPITHVCGCDSTEEACKGAWVDSCNCKDPNDAGGPLIDLGCRYVAESRVGQIYIYLKLQGMRCICIHARRAGQLQSHHAHINPHAPRLVGFLCAAGACPTLALAARPSQSKSMPPRGSILRLFSTLARQSLASWMPKPSGRAT